MKPLSKILLRVAGILPVVAFIVWRVYYACVSASMTGYVPLTYDYLFGSVMGINMICIAMACFVIYHQRNSMPDLDKPFRIVTFIIAGWLALCLLRAVAVVPRLIMVNGNWMLYIPVWMRAIGMALIATWLWMLSNRQGSQSLSKPLSTLILCSGILSVCLMVLMAVAGMYVACVGHVYNVGLGSHLFYNWIHYLVPIVLLGSYVIEISSHRCKENIFSLFIWLLFAVSICTMAALSIERIIYISEEAPQEQDSTTIDIDVQSILDEEMQKTVEATSPKWASAMVVEVPLGVVIASYSSDSVDRFNDTIDFGSLTLPLQLLEAIRSYHMSPYATANIHKEGIVIDSVRYVDSPPIDMTMDISDIIATSSRVGAATLLSQCYPEVKGYIFKRKSTMIDIADNYCLIANDLNFTMNDRDLFMIQKGLHDAVWNNTIGTASVRQWGGHILAYKAQSDSIHIAGKTGSAQIYRDGVYHTNEHRISFVGYFPEEAPKYCCLVVIESPSNAFYDAGLDCGGTVRRIAERIYVR